MSDTLPPQVQRLHLRRSGGFAGLKAEADVAVAQLGPAQRRALARLLQRPAGQPAQAAPGADRYHWRLQVHHADGSLRTLELGEDEMPDELATLAQPKL